MTATVLPSEWIPAANFNERRDGAQPEILVLHYTGVPTPEFAIEILTDGKREVSCHYLVHEDGRIVHMVDEEMRAWHAGAASWLGREDVNSRSIGIEIVNPGHGENYCEYPLAQVGAVTALSLDIVRRHGIEPGNVVAHSDVAPGRKVDPGEKFPWEVLAASGVGLWPGPQDGAGRAEPDAGRLQAGLAAFGYAIEITSEMDEQTGRVVRAFHLHYRRWAPDAAADAETQAILDTLLDASGRSCAV